MSVFRLVIGQAHGAGGCAAGQLVISACAQTTTAAAKIKQE
jgi:hypothetical protein